MRKGRRRSRIDSSIGSRIVPVIGKDLTTLTLMEIEVQGQSVVVAMIVCHDFSLSEGIDQPGLIDERITS